MTCVVIFSNIHTLLSLMCQVMMQLEQERHSSLSKESQLALLRQKIRSLIANGGGTGAVQGQDRGRTGPECCSHCTRESASPSQDPTATVRMVQKGNKKRPLPVSGWEELIDEASADLEQVSQGLVA